VNQSLISTKYYIPGSRPNHIQRSRLIEKLDAGLHRKLTLISAPAGYGKSSLAIAWLEGLQDDSSTRVKAAWLSLDDGDNSPVQFVSYLAAALDRVDGIAIAARKSLQGMLQSPQMALLEPILNQVLNEIASSNDRIVLVLDDYHLINSRVVQDAVSHLLQHLLPICTW
jgi:LuxR family maltose regulon positive regulatory protein